ncbi:exopolygalacturonase-like [Hibiscus syriacus]|uniref:Polygalacturonase n=1 Tax=Hibiscus syriacus TaxID=106335 RepID=A0A6A2XQZ6_HIBSY|nr:exopolygalacturonase clone GBGE184-like [Hibiscus syriacus]KAE8658777.1 exopolygalacturonase-like [Hibiscus syriacus]
MAFVTRTRITAVLLLCLVICDGCEGGRPFDEGNEGGASKKSNKSKYKSKDVGADKVDDASDKSKDVGDDKVDDVSTKSKDVDVDKVDDASNKTKDVDAGKVGDGLDKTKDVGVGKVGSDVKSFNVLDYGAKADGKTDSSINFIRTFKAACNFRGDAMMVIPKGNFLIGPVLFSGPCFNPSPLIVQAEGMVKAQSDISYFTGGADNTDWITFQSLKNGVILTGDGTFHGQGALTWKYNDCAHKSKCVRLPSNMKFVRVNDTIIRGIKSVDAKGFHIFVTVSSNVKIYNVNVQAPGNSPNTDGIHISKSNKIEISESVIATGDDCVSIIHGTSEISIKNVTCGPGHGFSIGSLGHYDDEADVSQISVTNSTLKGTTNGARIKTYKTDSPSKASNIFFKDLILENVANPIIIDQEYGNRAIAQASRVSISDVLFENIRGTSVSKIAVQLLCSKVNPCSGVEIKNVKLEYSGRPNDPRPFSSNCTNAKVIYAGTQSPPPCS